MAAYYNEIDPYAAQWLRNLIAAGHIAPGDVDTRSIVDVRPDDLKGYTQCHFFAGIGGWSYAARLAGWPDDRPLWTGSCPCQPFSVAGKQEGQADERHLWPVFFALINSRRPDVVMGEQVAAAVGKDWLDGVHSDLEGIGYACGAVVVPACAVDAPHRRDRLWFVADAHAPERREVDSLRGRDAREHAILQGQKTSSRSGADGAGHGQPGALAHPERAGSLPGSLAGIYRGEESRWSRNVEPVGHISDGNDDVGNALVPRLEGQSRHGDNRHQPGRIETQSTGPASEAGSGDVAYSNQSGESEGREQRGRQFSGISSNSRSSAWIGAEWLSGADGKARRFEPGIRLLAHGVPARVGKLRAYGNAIVPQVAAEVIAAFMDASGAYAMQEAA